jgi:hypothetical protein
LGTPSIRDEVDRLRKRAGIVFRKTQEQKQLQANQLVPDAFDKSESKLEHPVVSPITPSSTLVDESDTDKRIVEEDLSFIATFFAANVDDNEEESVIWDRLTSQVLSLYLVRSLLLITL